MDLHLITSYYMANDFELYIWVFTWIYMNLALDGSDNNIEVISSIPIVCVCAHQYTMKINETKHGLAIENLRIARCRSDAGREVR